MLSLRRPSVPIVAFTLSPIVARRLASGAGSCPSSCPHARSGTLVERMEAAWSGQRGADSYATVLLVTTSAQPSGINRLEVHNLGTDH